MKTIEWIDIELTSYCNLACPGCMREQLPYLKPHQKVPYFLKAFQQ